jgi:membrane-bound metal-dependent hydrolase YbcI (DUF457 family)
MFAVGHLALGYLCGKASSKILNVNVNIPLLFLASILPDIDFLVPGLRHRGPIHSLIVLSLFFIPLFPLYWKRAFPYFIALISHPLIGDYMTGGGLQLFWPLTTGWHSMGIAITPSVNILLEWALFIASFTMMLKVGDDNTLLRQGSSNLLLSLPLLPVLLSPFFGFPLHIPLELFIPHLAYLTLFILFILTNTMPRLKIT